MALRSEAGDEGEPDEDRGEIDGARVRGGRLQPHDQGRDVGSGPLLHPAPPALLRLLSLSPSFAASIASSSGPRAPPPSASTRTSPSSSRASPRGTRSMLEIQSSRPTTSSPPAPSASSPSTRPARSARLILLLLISGRSCHFD